MAEPTYTTVAACRAYAATDVALPADDTQLGDLIAKAERDVDTVLSPATTRAANGLKLVPGDLAGWQADALSRATCAQVEYRVVMGPEFFIKAQYDSVSGPDFTTRGELPRVGPQVYVELSETGLREVSDWASVRLTTFPAPPVA
jgi:hypothetical protein